ncbi:MAG: HEPN domain-containing protein [Desulfobacterales bacterium]|nr:HEPN domain-containing protein [Desulfobacterales bacterium]
MIDDNALNDLVQYRLMRAKETFNEAILMQREKHWNACANRLYYACFYSVIALLAKNKLSAKKHSGIKALFNQHFIKTGKVNKKKGELFKNLFEARQEGDYIDFVIFDEATIAPWINEVNDFISTISNLIDNGL